MFEQKRNDNERESSKHKVDHFSSCVRVQCLSVLWDLNVVEFLSHHNILIDDNIPVKFVFILNMIFYIFLYNSLEVNLSLMAVLNFILLTVYTHVATVLIISP